MTAFAPRLKRYWLIAGSREMKIASNKIILLIRLFPYLVCPLIIKMPSMIFKTLKIFQKVSASPNNKKANNIYIIFESEVMG